MSSYQRVALYVFFDSIERDLIEAIRQVADKIPDSILVPVEREKAKQRLDRREAVQTDDDDLSLLAGLDLGDKFQIISRLRSHLDQAASDYYTSIRENVEKAIPTRNAIMHGRPLTTTEFALGFSLANDFVKRPIYWPVLAATFQSYNQNPESFLQKAIPLLDEEDASGEVLNNLPVPDYDDTGFLPRPELEKELRKKILGRHPVITVLGEGGNGKTALTLQTLYGLVASNDHPFDAIIWTSAKSTRLGLKEIERIEGAIQDSLGVFEDVANQFEPGDASPLERVRRLLGENRILLVIDNLETILDDDLRDFAADVPGESKLVFTSRVPLGSDLSVHVGDFSETEARNYLRRLAEAYNVDRLKNKPNDVLDIFARRLGRKPLLLKWFALGVSSGLEPDRITTQPDLALRFCMENVIDRLSNVAKTVASAMAVLPTGVSAPLLQEVTGLNASDIETGVAELLRFAIIGRDEKVLGERSYQLGVSTKAYIARVLDIDEEFSNGVLKRFRGTGSAYQLERGGQSKDRFDPRHYVIRNRSEALVVKRLRQVFLYLNRGEFEVADGLIVDIRMLSPEYFEVYRVEAFVAIKSGDVPRALTCYEMALELAPEQPQLHLYHANFLSRSMDDYEGASKAIGIAMRLAPGTPTLVMEAMRIAFYSYQFERARELLGELSKMPLKGRDELIRADLTTQLYYREADYLNRIQDYQRAEEILLRLSMWLSRADRRLFDLKHLEHLRKAVPLLFELYRTPAFGNKGLLEIIRSQIQTIERGALRS